MEREIELAGIASLGAWLRRKPHHTAAPGTPCANCGTALQGPYCHRCGQLAEDFHRSIGHLVEETFENLLHLDGRLWRTLPQLLLRPARLTRDYLDGHRAAQIPPMRLFLVVVLLFFFAGGLGGKDPNIHFSYQGKPLSAADAKASGIRVGVGSLPGHKPGAMEAWVKPKVAYASSHKREYIQELESWAHRLAILLLPASAMMLGLLFVFQRRFFLYDHVIFSMHSLSFMGLLLSADAVLKAVGQPAPIADLLLLAIPVHLFVHMRGVYGLGISGTLVRMALLSVMTVVVLFLGAVLLFSLSLAFMPTTVAA